MEQRPLGNKLLSEVQKFDKYARWIPELNRRETWNETTDRVVGFFKSELKKMGKDISKIPWNELEDGMLKMDVLPSMRAVQMAGPAAARDHTHLYNCFSGDTRYVTKEGIKTFKDTVGTTQMVLAGDGQWREAFINYYGKQILQEVELRPGARSRTELRHKVRVTPNHRWITTKGETTQLQVGDLIPANGVDANFDLTEWVKGFGFGDGAQQDGYCHIRLCGDKVKWLPYFEQAGGIVSYPPSAQGDPCVYFGKRLGNWKSLPDNPTPSWMAGLLAADGHMNEVQPGLSTQNRELAIYVEQNAAQLGIVVTGWNELTSNTNYGERKNPLIRLGIRSAEDVQWKVTGITILEKADVYCAMEPVTRQFTLERGVLTGNCAYLPLDSPTALKELLYILMCGTGVGYSVEKQYIEKWRQPKVAEVYPGVPAVDSDDVGVWTIEDSSIGWAEAFHRAIDLSLDGIEPRFDYGRIRPKGAWLRTKGGRASGPEPLRRLLTGVWTIISARNGSALTPFDIHRIACLAGSIVDVGGVRRAALISLFSSGDDVMRDCKSQEDWFDKFPELAKANNSMVAQRKDIRSVFRTLSRSGYGEPGLFNRHSYHTRANGVEYGTNPCGEVLLEPSQFCNLSITVARPDDTIESLCDKVRLAAIWGTIQSCMTYFPNLRPQWTLNCERERLLGVDITGTQDCPLLNARVKPQHLGPRLRYLRDEAHKVNRQYAHVLGINQSAAITCNKPSGNSSQLVDCSSGIHARWAPYYVRRLRIEPHSPLGTRLKSLGIPCEVEYIADVPSQWIFEFPVKSPSQAVVKDDLNALQQFHYWSIWQSSWCDHNASSTLYVEPHMWEALEEEVTYEWDLIGGLSFLPKDNTKYWMAPYETITKEEYEERLAKLPQRLDLESLNEMVDNSTLSRDAACVGGLCEF